MRMKAGGPAACSHSPAACSLTECRQLLRCKGVRVLIAWGATNQKAVPLHVLTADKVSAVIGMQYCSQKN